MLSIWFVLIVLLLVFSCVFCSFSNFTWDHKSSPSYFYKHALSRCSQVKEGGDFSYSYKEMFNFINIPLNTSSFLNTSVPYSIGALTGRSLHFFSDVVFSNGSTNLFATEFPGFLNGYSNDLTFDAQNVLVGDFNNDGILDMIACGVKIGGDQHPLLVFFGDPSGQYLVKQNSFDGISGEFYGCTIADFNGDGKLDLKVDNLFVMNVGSEERNVIPHSSFPPELQNFLDPLRVEAVDLDNDGFVDLIVGGHFIDGRMHVLWGNGEKNILNQYKQFWEIPFPIDGHLMDGESLTFRDVIVEDFDGDGRLDMLILYNHYSRDIYGATNLFRFQLMMNRNGEFVDETSSRFSYWGNVESTTPIYRFFCRDFDGDGYVDIIALKPNEKGIMFWKNDGKGNFNYSKLDEMNCIEPTLSNLGFRRNGLLKNTVNGSLKADVFNVGLLILIVVGSSVAGCFVLSVGCLLCLCVVSKLKKKKKERVVVNLGTDDEMKIIENVENQKNIEEKEYSDEKNEKNIINPAKDTNQSVSIGEIVVPVVDDSITKNQVLLQSKDSVVVKTSGEIKNEMKSVGGQSSHIDIATKVEESLLERTLLPVNEMNGNGIAYPEMPMKDYVKEEEETLRKKEEEFAKERERIRQEKEMEEIEDKRKKMKEKENAEKRMKEEKEELEKEYGEMDRKMETLIVIKGANEKKKKEMEEETQEMMDEMERMKNEFCEAEKMWEEEVMRKKEEEKEKEKWIQENLEKLREIVGKGMKMQSEKEEKEKEMEEIRKINERMREERRKEKEKIEKEREEREEEMEKKKGRRREKEEKFEKGERIVESMMKEREEYEKLWREEKEKKVEEVRELGEKKEEMEKENQKCLNMLEEVKKAYEEEVVRKRENEKMKMGVVGNQEVIQGNVLTNNRQSMQGKKIVYLDEQGREIQISPQTNVEKKVVYIDEQGRPVSTSQLVSTNSAQEKSNVKKVVYVDENGKEIGSNSQQQQRPLNYSSGQKKVIYVDEFGREIQIPPQAQPQQMISINNNDAISSLTNSTNQSNVKKKVVYVDENGREIQMMPQQETIPSSTGKKVVYVDEMGRSIQPNTFVGNNPAPFSYGQPTTIGLQQGNNRQQLLYQQQTTMQQQNNIGMPVMNNNNSKTSITVVGSNVNLGINGMQQNMQNQPMMQQIQQQNQYQNIQGSGQRKVIYVDENGRIISS